MSKWSRFVRALKCERSIKIEPIVLKHLTDGILHQVPMQKKNFYVDTDQLDQE